MSVTGAFAQNVLYEFWGGYKIVTMRRLAGLDATSYSTGLPKTIQGQ